MTTETTRQQVLRLTKAGIKPREISYLCNISTQMVHKHLKNLRRDGELDFFDAREQAS